MDIISTRFSRLAALVGLIFIAYMAKSVLVGPPRVDTDHVFQTDRALARLERILGDERPHPVDSDANDAVRERLLQEIEQLGFDPFVRDQFQCSTRWGQRASCARVQNVGFWVTPPGPNAVLVMSHYDSVPAGPGASDDGAGIAASLEIASILKDTPQTRPLLVLITDGEETGLFGARAFVEKDPLASQIGAVVNMEARGVRGPTTLIQTSRPNGRDLAALSHADHLPNASSLNADIYELLPNDTDLTEFLHLDIDAANYAYSQGVGYYHTPADNLANLDPRALFHLGINGLAATTTFLGQSGDEAEESLLYVDILGRFVLLMPIWFGGGCVIFGGLIAGILLFRARKKGALWRSMAWPPAALILGTGLAVGATFFVGWIRPEANFGGAYPIALRGAHIASALLGALFAHLLLKTGVSSKQALSAAWLWTAILAGAGLAFVPGSTILFAPALAVFGVAGLLIIYGHDRIGHWVAATATLAFAIIALPLGALGENGLLIEGAAPFAIVGLFLFLFGAPLLHDLDRDEISPSTQIVDTITKRPGVDG
ncbi:MAG: M20/M25/M40 family metallo-hydrolase, partial [Pseudomonadota bacterium]